MDLVAHLSSLLRSYASHSSINYNPFNNAPKYIIAPNTEEELEAQSKHYLPKLRS